VEECRAAFPVGGERHRKGWICRQAVGQQLSCDPGWRVAAPLQTPIPEGEGIRHEAMQGGKISRENSIPHITGRPQSALICEHGAVQKFALDGSLSDRQNAHRLRNFLQHIQVSATAELQVAVAKGHEKDKSQDAVLPFDHEAHRFLPIGQLQDRMIDLIDSTGTLL